MTVIVTMVVLAVRAVHMRRRCWRLRWCKGMAVGMRGCAVGAAFGLKIFLNLIDDEVHGAQQVGQHVVGLDLQVVGFELNWHVAIAKVVGRARQVKR